MGKNSVVELKGRDELIDPLSELLVTGTRQLIAQTVEAELQELDSACLFHPTNWILSSPNL